ncbi:MAG TPA: fumarylacetoacetate hydrolase family protein [Micromonosporaceae bacterium]|nr:fumarylacetoacetate hydrolase family protein [Micromonosporaceae bacterium]
MTTAARLVAEARLAGELLGELPEECRPASEEDGYQVQRAVHRHLAERGRGALAGYKVGCTTRALQEFLGTDHPGAGGVLASAVHHGSGAFRFQDYRRPGVECEVAVVLGEDLTPDRAPFTTHGVAAAVASCAAAIEVVDNRYTDLRALGTPTLIADDLLAAGCVLGPPAAGFDPQDLREVAGELKVDGQPVGHGSGRDILGDPLVALAWLADTLASQQTTLYAGQFVLLGSVATHWLTAPGEAVATSSPLGTVSATFA